MNNLPEFLPETTSKRSVKAYLLDQGNVAGIGNYLADESLFRARIHPLSRACDMRREDWSSVLKSARDLSQQVLSLGGVSLRDYVNTDNLQGAGRSLLLAYGRGGEECVKCGLLLDKTKVAGRGTVYCSACQVILPEQ